MSFDTLARQVDAKVVKAFGLFATLNGSPVQCVFDTQTEVVSDDGVVTQAPAVTIQSLMAPTVAPGQTMAIGAQSYIVRRVVQLPPDGQLLQLVLARA